MNSEELQKEFEKACKEMKIIPSVPNVGGIPTAYQQQVIDAYMLMVITDYKALNNK